MLQTRYIRNFLKCRVYTMGAKKFYSRAPKIEYVISEKAPRAVGPYSQAVKVNGTMYVSGCLGIEPSSGDLISDKTVDQARQALLNLKNILEAGGSNLESVVKTTILLEDISDYSEVNAIYSEFFENESLPARTCYAVKQLPKNAKVEIEAIAVYNPAFEQPKEEESPAEETKE